MYNLEPQPPRYRSNIYTVQSRTSCSLKFFYEFPDIINTLCEIKTKNPSLRLDLYQIKLLRPVELQNLKDPNGNTIAGEFFI